MPQPRDKLPSAIKTNKWSFSALDWVYQTEQTPLQKDASSALTHMSLWRTGHTPQSARLQKSPYTEGRDVAQTGVP